MNEESTERVEDRFADFADQIAAHARQIFRAIHAQDRKALDVSMFYFQGFLVKVLGSHLKDDPRWSSIDRWLDILDVESPIFEPPARISLRGKLDWVTRDQCYWYVEPFEFQLELNPVTGEFVSYSFQYGDHRPLADKKLLSPATRDAEIGPGDKGWSFVFHYNKTENDRRGKKKETS